MPHHKIPPAQLKEEEADRLEALIRRYYADILSYAFWRLKDRHNAEDVTQETFIKAARYFNSFSNQGKFRGLLYKIAANLCVDQLRKKQTAPLSETIITAENGFAAVEDQDGFVYLLKFLPEELKEVVLLRYGYDLKIREVADAVGLPLRTVQSRLRTALKVLKNKIKKEEKSL